MCVGDDQETHTQTHTHREEMAHNSQPSKARQVETQTVISYITDSSEMTQHSLLLTNIHIFSIITEDSSDIKYLKSATKRRFVLCLTFIFGPSSRLKLNSQKLKK